jgi:hypothetical protein
MNKSRVKNFLGEVLDMQRCFLMVVIFFMFIACHLSGTEGRTIRLESTNGIGLVFEESGDIKAVMLNGVPLNSGGIRGGFFIYDFSTQKGWRYLPTKAKKVGGDIFLVGEDEKLKFKVEARWSVNTEREYLSFKAIVQDLTGRDRIAIIAYRLPVNLKGWKWWYDIEESAIIKPNNIYSNTWYIGPYSVYPWTAVTHPQKGGLSLAVPMHPPRPFRLVAGTKEGLAAEYDFGFIPENKTYPSRADFQLLLYAHDPAWGFRSAAQLYYKFFPEYFEVRVERQGLWYVSHKPFGELTNPERFSFVFNEVSLPQRERIREFVEIDKKRGSYTFAYTEPWGWWSWAIGLQLKFKLTPKVPYEKAVAYLRELAADKERKVKGGIYNHAVVAETILNSGIHTHDGKLYVSHYSPYYGYMWHVNPSPYAVSGDKIGRFHVTYEWEIERSLKMGASGIYLDSIIGTWTGAENYQRKQLATTIHPLTFSRKTFKPIQLGVWNHYEFIEYLARDLRGRGKFLMANIFPYNWVFFNHQLDIIGHEVFGMKTAEEMRIDPKKARIFAFGPGNVYPAKMRAGRTLAYHKPYCWLWAGPILTLETREQWLRETMMYGIFFNIGEGEDYSLVYKTYMPIILSMAEAGWEPVTYARVVGEGAKNIRVERFGPKGGNLFFSLRNEGISTARIRLVIDNKALKIPIPKEAMRLPEGDMLFVGKDGSIELELLPAMVTVVRIT